MTRVWIDQDLCTGDGLCAEICEPLFFMHDDGLAYVREEGDSGVGPDGEPKNKMAKGTVNVPDHLLQDTIDSADDCPGECIFIEVE